MITGNEWDYFINFKGAKGKAIYDFLKRNYPNAYTIKEIAEAVKLTERQVSTSTQHLIKVKKLIERRGCYYRFIKIEVN